jgi:hypothetical protein
VVNATSRTVPGSIIGDATGFFSDILPDRTMALGSTRPSENEYKEDFLGVKMAGV